MSEWICKWCGDEAVFITGKGWVHKSTGKMYATKTMRHERCPECGSKNIKEIKPKWGICFDCHANFHIEYEIDDHCILPIPKDKGGDEQ